MRGLALGLRPRPRSHSFRAVEDETRKAVLALIDAYNARDMDALLALFDPHVEWHTTPGFLWPGPYRGRDALRELFEHWWQGWERGHADAQEIVVAEGHAMVSADIHGRSAGDGLDVHVPLNWVFHVRDGRIDLVRSYESPEQARAAVG
jgi:ketosteroid isomerase-like protein